MTQTEKINPDPAERMQAKKAEPTAGRPEVPEVKIQTSPKTRGCNFCLAQNYESSLTPDRKIVRHLHDVSLSGVFLLVLCDDCLALLNRRTGERLEGLQECPPEMLDAQEEEHGHPEPELNPESGRMKPQCPNNDCGSRQVLLSTRSLQDEVVVLVDAEGSLSLSEKLGSSVSGETGLAPASRLHDYDLIGGDEGGLCPECGWEGVLRDWGQRQRWA